MVRFGKSGGEVWDFLGGSEVKASACNAGDLGSFPGSGRSLEKEMATSSSILAWRIPWREEPGRLSFPGGSVVKNCLPMQEMQVQSLGWEDPLEKETATHPSILV